MSAPLTQSELLAEYNKALEVIDELNKDDSALRSKLEAAERSREAIGEALRPFAECNPAISVADVDRAQKALADAPPSEWVRKSELDAVIDWACFAKEALNEVAAYGNCDCEPDEPCVYCQCVNANDLGTPIIEKLKTLRGEK